MLTIHQVEIVDTTDENPDKATILATSRLFVRNLAFSCTDEELRQLFEPYGHIAQVSLRTCFRAVVFSRLRDEEYQIGTSDLRVC